MRLANYLRNGSFRININNNNGVAIFGYCPYYNCDVKFKIEKPDSVLVEERLELYISVFKKDNVYIEKITGDLKDVIIYIIFCCILKNSLDNDVKIIVKNCFKKAFASIDEYYDQIQNHYMGIICKQENLLGNSYEIHRMMEPILIAFALHVDRSEFRYINKFYTKNIYSGIFVNKGCFKKPYQIFKYQIAFSPSDHHSPIEHHGLYLLDKTGCDQDDWRIFIEKEKSSRSGSEITGKIAYYSMLDKTHI